VDDPVTVLPAFRHVLVVDDSTENHASLLGDLSRVLYISSGENLGIAHALNVGCQAASALGAGWVLTMDQDSAWAPTELKRFLSAAFTLASDLNVAIIAPNFCGSGIPASADGSLGPRDCNSVISAGSLLRLEAFRRVGGYNEALFIDQVDHELGYRLRNAGMRIVRFEGIVMQHEVGAPLRTRLLGRNIVAGGHSAIRKYYMVRNALYMRKRYAAFGAPYLEMILLMAIGVLVLEQDKWSKLGHMLKGAWHYFRGFTGKMR